MGQPIDDLKVAHFGIPKIKKRITDQNRQAVHIKYKCRSSLQLVPEEND